MFNINSKQIEAVLQVVYSTNIPAAQFDALRKLLSELPKVEPKIEDKAE